MPNVSTRLSLHPRWQVQAFDRLDIATLYELLTLRQQVFVVEQRCAYLDCDGLDQRSHHLYALLDQSTEIPSHSSGCNCGSQYGLVAYCRIIAPTATDLGTNVAAPVGIGRVLVHPDYRGHGLATQLLRRALAFIILHYPNHPVQLAAQAHLQRFYRTFGFVAHSNLYLEDGIEHIDMVLWPKARL